MSKRIIAPSLLAVLCLCLPAAAQEIDVLERLFGAGVHAYYSGDYQTAHQDLSSVIERGTKDPRPYYFRALALIRLGRPEEAQADLNAGSDLETQDIDGSYPVSRSLERVQGSSRAQVEKFRTKARLASLNRKRDQDKQRYEAIQKREQEVLRRQVNVPLGDAPAAGAKPPAVNPADDPAAEPAADDPAMEEPASDDPFAEPAAKPAADDGEPAAEEPAADDPFAEPAAKPKAAPAASDDPFGGDAAMEEDTPPADGDANSGDAAAEDDAAPADDPFGGDEPATKAPAAKKAAPKAPPVEPAAEDADDPFGGAASDTEEMPAEEKPADDNDAADDKEPAEDSGDPFGDDTKPADSDEPADDAKADDAKADDEKPAEEDAKEDDSDPFGLFDRTLGTRAYA